jgi:hypothetical protein
MRPTPRSRVHSPLRFGSSVDWPLRVLRRRQCSIAADGANMAELAGPRNANGKGLFAISSFVSL